MSVGVLELPAIQPTAMQIDDRWIVQRPVKRGSLFLTPTNGWTSEVTESWLGSRFEAMQLSLLHVGSRHVPLAEYLW
jgi:hypothetical protein